MRQSTRAVLRTRVLYIKYRIPAGGGIRKQHRKRQRDQDTNSSPHSSPIHLVVFQRECPLVASITMNLARPSQAPLLQAETW
ncbi:hypothetical protein SAMN04488557_1089 [Hyphomicrobium facile]|uniref:Uncharacterized protein n=1 Tax=Hyphomicrobium facile TaxID=51670 RepID=A0A1I7N2C4_9HYPH|nr:hypothetical protein SAMN04488557_1089 [Hyphomicrobium facile]